MREYEAAFWIVFVLAIGLLWAFIFTLSSVVDTWEEQRKCYDEVACFVSFGESCGERYGKERILGVVE